MATLAPDRPDKVDPGSARHVEHGALILRPRRVSSFSDVEVFTVQALHQIAGLEDVRHG